MSISRNKIKKIVIALEKNKFASIYIFKKQISKQLFPVQNPRGNCLKHKDKAGTVRSKGEFGPIRTEGK